MKKWTSTSLGGAPADGDDLLDIFNSEIWDAIQSILSPYNSDTQGVIVSGCVITGSSPYAMTAGIVYLNGDFMRMPAVASMTLPQYIQPDTAVNDTRTYADGTSHVVAVTKSAKIASAAPGSGQYVAITTTTDPDDRRFSFLNGSFLLTKVFQIGDWDMDSNSLKSVTHDLPDFKKIRDVSVIIRDDSDSAYTKIENVNVDPNGYQNGCVALIDSTTIQLSRNTGGMYDSTSYNSTSFNRGWVTITYER